MAAENVTLGEERIAAELSLKLKIQVSPRTVGKYLRSGGPIRKPDPHQRWLTFVRNHSKVIVACDFFVVVTAAFRTLYVFVAMEISSRRMLHQNVTSHPTSEWTLQQLREALPGDHPYRFVLHNRDNIFLKQVDAELRATPAVFGACADRAPLFYRFCTGVCTCRNLFVASRGV
jgi:putative transposase